MEKNECLKKFAGTTRQTGRGFQGKFILSIFITVAFLSTAFTQTVPKGVPTSSLTIDVTDPTTPISPTLYGLMLDDTPYAIDGGLYAELIRNKNFQGGGGNNAGWSMSCPEGDEASMSVINRRPLSSSLLNSLEVRVKIATADHPVSITNDGYWGIPVKPSTTYHTSFYVSCLPDFNGTLKVSLQNSDGSKTYASAETSKLTGPWQKFSLTLSTSAEVTASNGNIFVISAQNAGTFFLTNVSLFPPTYQGEPNGFRADLIDKLKALNPSFLRFPGGSYLNGNTFIDRIDWKNTRGPLFSRPGHNNRGGYRGTDGMGLLEFMECCEDLNALPILEIYDGYIVKQSPIEPGPLLEPFVDDALCELDYLMGDAKTSYWGALRAKDGHPDPFVLPYIEIGSWVEVDATGSYEARFVQFFDAIRTKYPDLKVIAAGPIKSRSVNLYEDHALRTIDTTGNMSVNFDSGNSNGAKLFVGDWASRNGASSSDMGAALRDAIWMIALEKNSNLVAMSCHAPLLFNANRFERTYKVETPAPGDQGGDKTATPQIVPDKVVRPRNGVPLDDQIVFDGLSCYVTPAYEMQLLSATHLGDVLLPAQFQSASGVSLPFNVTRNSKTGKIYIKVVNNTGSEQSLKVIIKGSEIIPSDAVVTSMHATSTDDTNSLETPTKVIPVTVPLSDWASPYTYELEPNSITIFEMVVPT